MSETHNTAEATPPRSRAASPDSVSPAPEESISPDPVPLPEESTSPDPAPPAPEESISPVQLPTATENNTNGAAVNEKSSNPTNVQEEPIKNSSDPRPDAQKRKSTIKHQAPDSPKSPQPRPKDARRPSAKRRGSTASVQSRYSEMAMDYFESIPSKYNAYAGFFTWIFLAGFVLGPSAQQATGLSGDQTGQSSGGQTSPSPPKGAPKGLMRKVPLLAVSVVGSGIGGLGMLVLWIRWRKNYIWLIHKLFLPGALNGLAGTLAVTVNIWAIQGGSFHFSTATIVTFSITLGSTVICLVLTFIYQFLLLSMKKEHRRLVRQANSDEGLEDGPNAKQTAGEQDFSDVKDSFWNALTN